MLANRNVDATYLVPIKRDRCAPLDDLPQYLQWLSHYLDVLVVDGSPPEVFAHNAGLWGDGVRHLPTDPALRTPNGKVGNVLTGLRAASHERVVIADDDVRYDLPGLTRVLALLETAEVVRPQNYFSPLPWHARWDTPRSLLARLHGGDWPGTLAVRRSVVLDAGGYRGDVLFENYELVQTVRAAGGRETVPLDLFVRRVPPSSRHFLRQRVRQAYDEFCRPARCVIYLTLFPLVLLLSVFRQWAALSIGAAASMLLAEAGRRRGNGRAVFPSSAVFFTPMWLLERALCMWLALGTRLLQGGVRYGDTIISIAASPPPPKRAACATAGARSLMSAAPGSQPGLR